MNKDQEQQTGTNHQKLEQAFIDLAKNWSLWNTPLEQALSELTKHVAETMKASRCSIWVMTEKADAITLLDLYDLDSQQHSSGARLEESTFPAYFKALQEERVIDAVDAHTDYRTREFSGPYLTPLGIGSMLDATLWQSGETHGVLCIEQRNGPRLWSEAEKQYAFSVADLISSLLISDRIRISERKLQKSLATQNAILDAAYYGIIYTDVEGTIQGFNATAERMLGYREDEVIGKVTPAIIHDEAEIVERAEELSRELGETIEPGFEVFTAIPKRFHKPDERVWTYIHKNGSRIPALLSVTSVRDEQGELIGYLGISSDISERIESEKRLKSSEKKLAHAQAVAHMGYWDLDMTNGQAEWSDEEYRLLGYEPGSVEADSESFMNAVHPDDRNAVTSAMQAAMDPAQGGLYETEHRILLPNGSVRIVQEKGSVTFDEQGKPLHMFGTTLDITDLVLSEQALTSPQKRYQTLFNASSDAILVMNEENFIECNKSTLEMFGCTRDEIVGESPVLFSPQFQPDGRVSAVKALEKIRAAYRGERQRFEWQHIRYDGTPFDAEVTLTYLEIEGEPCLLANVRDISEKKKAELALKSSEYELRERNESLSIINELSSMLQESDDIRSISSKTCEHLRSTALKPRVAFYLLSNDGDFMNLVAHAGIDQALAFAGERITVDGSLSGKAIREKHIIISGDISAEKEIDPTVQHALVSMGIKSAIVIPLVYQGKPLGSLNLVFDETHQFNQIQIDTLAAAGRTVSLAVSNARQVSDLEHEAHHDSLTGLPNRAQLHEIYAHEVLGKDSKSNKAVLMLMDLDKFKEINDTLGHHVGDKVLKQVAARLEMLISNYTGMIARLGGDEFTILLTQVDDPKQIELFAQSLREIIRDPYEIDHMSLEVDASIGIAIAPFDGKDSHELLRKADVAMYQAKQNNLGYAHYDPGIDSHSRERLAMINDLGKAIRGDEISVHFQPKLDLLKKTIYGFEALVRWNHPEMGLLMPGQFIPIAEMSATIHGLTQKVLELALKEQKGWIEKGYEYSVSVNLSARNLLDEELVPWLQKALEQFGTPPELLELEITESTLMQDPEGSIDQLNEISKLGIKLSIDDFGTGYSSLSYLKKLPIDTLKIDRSFVMEMNEDDQDQIIVRSTIGLAHNLGLRVVAEGVEDLPSIHMLRQMGCDQLQGYYISKPRPWAELEAWLSDYQFSL